MQRFGTIILIFFTKGIDKCRICDIIYRYEKNVPLAQPDRVFGYEPKGRGFESLMVRQKRTIPNRVWCVFVSPEGGHETTL